MPPLIKRGEYRKVSIKHILLAVKFLDIKKPPKTVAFKTGGGKEGRTPDLCNAIATLYQLSYTPKGHEGYYTQIYTKSKRKMKKVYFSTSSSVTIS